MSTISLYTKTCQFDYLLEICMYYFKLNIRSRGNGLLYLYKISLLQNEVSHEVSREFDCGFLDHQVALTTKPQSNSMKPFMLSPRRPIILLCMRVSLGIPLWYIMTRQSGEFTLCYHPNTCMCNRGKIKMLLCCFASH